MVFPMTEVVELRQYTLRPGRRDELVELFEREFVEPQEAVGMRLLGQFHDLDDEDRFVWLRSFPDLATRPTALAAFYDGPVWAAHRDAANATMVDSDDVLLLRPVGAGLDLDPAARPAPGAAAPESIVTVTLYHLPDGTEDDFAAFFADEVEPVLVKAGAPPVARLRTEPAENNYPRLPVRAGENVFAWIAVFGTADELGEHVKTLGAAQTWTHDVRPALGSRLRRPPEQIQLRPTPRSLLR
jgi:NIPSNAP protein